MNPVYNSYLTSNHKHTVKESNVSMIKTQINKNFSHKMRLMHIYIRT